MSYTATLTRYIEVPLIRGTATLEPIPLAPGRRYFKTRQCAVAWVTKTNMQFGAGTAVYTGKS